MRHEWKAAEFGEVVTDSVEQDEGRIQFYRNGSRRYDSPECEIDEESAGREILRLAARVRELEGGRDTAVAQGIIAERARGNRDLAALEGALQQVVNERDALAERVKLLDRLEEETVRPAFEKMAALEEHIRQAREYLRIECGELGDNDWPDDLHLGDVIEKHLARPAAARIAALEEENRRLREGLGVASSFGGGTTCPDGEPHRAKCSRCDAPLKLTPPGSAA